MSKSRALYLRNMIMYYPLSCAFIPQTPLHVSLELRSGLGHTAFWVEFLWNFPLKVRLLNEHFSTQKINCDWVLDLLVVDEKVSSMIHCDALSALFVPSILYIFE